MTVNTVVENQPETNITKGLNIYQKINRIMQEVSYIQKDAKITLLDFDHADRDVEAVLLRHGKAFVRNMGTPGG